MADNNDKRETAWARPVSGLHVDGAPADAINLNVEGRQVVSPLQGFGALWRKTYRVRLSGAEATPEQVVTLWKSRLPELMPADSRFYPSLAGVRPGEVVLINARLPLVPTTISTGVLILYADDESFSVMTPEGHPESGFNTFSAYSDDGATVAQIQSLCRATDPLYEFGFRYMGGAAQQERIWQHVLTQLAARFGVRGQVQVQKECIDGQLQWGQARNLWHNAMLRSVLYAPVHFARRLTGRG